LFKEIVDGRTHARTHGLTTDDGRPTLKDHKSSLSTLCSGELKNFNSYKIMLCRTNSYQTEPTMIAIAYMYMFFKDRQIKSSKRLSQSEYF